MKMKLILCSLATLLPFVISASAAPDPNFHIYLCFGQSNMESGGKMDEADRTVDKRFQVLADFDSTNRGWKKGQWYDAVKGCQYWQRVVPNLGVSPDYQE